MDLKSLQKPKRLLGGALYTVTKRGRCHSRGRGEKVAENPGGCTPGSNLRAMIMSNNDSLRQKGTGSAGRSVCKPSIGQGTAGRDLRCGAIGCRNPADCIIRHSRHGERVVCLEHVLGHELVEMVGPIGDTPTGKEGDTK